MKRRGRMIRWTSVAVCEAITIFVLLRLIANGAVFSRYFLTCITLLLILLPEGLERVFHCRINTGLYIFCTVYAIGPMLGHAMNWYFLFPPWDKLLHTAGGVVFALAGIFLFQKFGGKEKGNLALTAVFAFLFSVTLSVLWEFFEFGMDIFLGMDMQDDTVITSIHSYLLGEPFGTVGSLENIQSISINGVQMPWQGYLDIGLLDTMIDMLVETAGALIAAGIFLLDRGRHPLVRFVKSQSREGERIGYEETVRR